MIFMNENIVIVNIMNRGQLILRNEQYISKIETLFELVFMRQFF